MAAAPVNLSEMEFLRFGLAAVGFSETQQAKMSLSTREQAFRSHFTATPKSCSQVFSDIQRDDLVGDKRIRKASYVYFLMAINWLTDYPEAVKLAGRFKIGVRTVYKWQFPYVQAIAACMGSKVSLRVD
jgi:hypothetical protein